MGAMKSMFLCCSILASVLCSGSGSSHGSDPLGDGVPTVAGVLASAEEGMESSWSVDSPVDPELIAELIHRYLVFLDETPVETELNDYVDRARRYLSELEAREGIEAVWEYVKWAEDYVLELEADPERTGEGVGEGEGEGEGRGCDLEKCCGGPANPPFGCFNCTYGLFCALMHTGTCTGCDPVLAVGAQKLVKCLSGVAAAMSRALGNTATDNLDMISEEDAELLESLMPPQ